MKHEPSTTTVRIPSDIAASLREPAKAAGASLSGHVSTLLRAAIEGPVPPQFAVALPPGFTPAAAVLSEWAQAPGPSWCMLVYQSMVREIPVAAFGMLTDVGPTLVELALYPSEAKLSVPRSRLLAWELQPQKGDTANFIVTKMAGLQRAGVYCHPECGRGLSPSNGVLNAQLPV